MRSSFNFSVSAFPFSSAFKRSTFAFILSSSLSFCIFKAKDLRCSCISSIPSLRFFKLSSSCCVNITSSTLTTCASSIRGWYCAIDFSNLSISLLNLALSPSKSPKTLYLERISFSIVSKSTYLERAFLRSFQCSFPSASGFVLISYNLGL